MPAIPASRPLLGVLSCFTLLFLASSPAQGQTAYTWNGPATSDWLTPGNWTPSGPPGVAGAAPNSDVALFDTAGTSITATGLDSGYSLGTIATIGSSGGQLTASFNGNSALRLAGSHTIGSFTNVVAAAQNGRDLTIQLTNMSFSFGTSGSPSTFFADSGRTLTVVVQQIANAGGNLNKDGGGTLILGGSSGSLRDLNGAAININAGTLAAHETFSNITQVNVAPGARLQAGLAVGGNMSTGATIDFENNSGLRVLTNGSSVTQLQNAPVTKNPNDIFQITLAGLDPTGIQTFTPNGIIVQASSLTGFDPNGTYTPLSPGHFAVSGDGFMVTDWNLTVLNNNQVRLDNVTVAPVPEPGSILLIGALSLGFAGTVRRRAMGRPVTP